MGLLNWFLNTLGGVCAGGIVGYAVSSTFYNCSNWCNVELATSKTSSYLYAGGIAGRVYDYTYYSTIELCKNLGNVTVKSEGSGNTWFAGGICGGGTYNRTSVLKCCNYGTITAGNYKVRESHAGGISGDTVLSIKDCYNMGAITSKVKKIESSSSFSLTLTDSSKYNASRIAECSGVYSIYSPITYTIKTQDYNTYFVPKNIYVICQDTRNAEAGGICGGYTTRSSISNCYNYGIVSGGTKYVEINSSFILQYMLPSSNYTGSYTARELWFKFKLDCYAGISYGSIGAFDYILGSSSTRTNCYYCRSAIANPLSSLESEITTLGFYDYVYNHSGFSRTQRSGYLKSGYRYSKRTSAYNLTNSSLTNTHYSTNINSGSLIESISIQISIDSNNYNINIPVKSTSSTSAWALSANISNYDYSYKYLGDENIGVKYMYANSIPSGFSSDIWATSPAINDGYPYLKEIYW